MTRTAMVLTFFLLLTPGLSAAGKVDILEEELKHFSYKRRLAAISELEAIGGKDAAKAVLTVVDDKDWEVQIRAFEALGRLKYADAFEPVAKAVAIGPIIRVRRAAVEALVKMEVKEGYQKLLKTVRKAREETIKIRALHAADKLAGPEDVNTIVTFLGDREAKIRAAACRALGHTKSPTAEKFLLKMIRDKDIQVRVGAMIGLGGVRSPKSMEAIHGLVMLERDPYVAERALRALRKFESGPTAEFLAERAAAQRRPELKARAVKLLAGLNHPDAGPYLVTFLADAFPNVRAWAARGIGQCRFVDGISALRPLVQGDKVAVVRRMAFEALMVLLEEPAGRGVVVDLAVKGDSPELKIRACVYVRRLGLKDSLPTLFPLVDDPNWRVSTAAMISIGTLGHKDEVPILAKRVGDPDWKIRAAALEGLGQLRHMTVVPYLLKGLQDRDHIARNAALLNLQVLAQSKRGVDLAGWKKWYAQNKDSLDITKKGYREEVKKDGYAKSKYLIQVLNRAQIVCVLGKYDHAEWVLQHLKIKHTVIRPQEIATVGLNPKQLLLINCEGTIGKKASFERVQWFVHVGGFIIATDWALQNTVARVFPGYIDKDSKSKTGNDVVEIEAADPEHPLLDGVFDGTRKLKWWLEIIAFPMAVLDEFRAEILVDSLEMLRKYFSSPMAAVFDFGHGKVETCVSHFFLQEEGLSGLTTAEARKIFAADSLGLTLNQIRKLESKGFFDGQITEAMTKEIAEDYSMFMLIVNFVVEKRRQVEQQ